jgi:diguanylate cyclase (GGDEF)-like protein
LNPLVTRTLQQATQRVLLVEDNPGDARLVRELLELGWDGELSLHHVTTLAEAAVHVAAGDAGCVLLDLSLPDAQGLEALDALREASPELPIVVLSGLSDEMTALRAVQAGAQDYLIKGRADEGMLARSIRYAVERKRSESQLLHQALHDPLTDLPNRALFLDRVSVALARCERLDTLVAVLAVDLDRFKVVNDSLGHGTGDELLVSVAGRLRACLPSTLTLARFGGDEFTILSEDMLDKAEALAIADQVTAALAEPFQLGDADMHLTASIGIALASDGKDAAALVRDADAAMHRAKERGKSRHEVFEEGLRENAMRRLEVEQSLHGALARDEFELRYQPKVSLRDGRVVGLEALLRWNHPERGMVGPNDFIPVAEETGVIVEIGAWVLDRACAQLAEWRPLVAGSRIQMAVNLSARQLREPELIDVVVDTLARHHVQPSELILEITESLLVEENEATQAAFAALETLGVQLAVDDFGTGYSSLAALKRFPADLL